MSGEHMVVMVTSRRASRIRRLRSQPDRWKRATEGEVAAAQRRTALLAEREQAAERAARDALRRDMPGLPEQHPPLPERLGVAARRHPVDIHHFMVAIPGPSSMDRHLRQGHGIDLPADTPRTDVTRAHLEAHGCVIRDGKVIWPRRVTIEQQAARAELDAVKARRA